MNDSPDDAAQRQVQAVTLALQAEVALRRAAEERLRAAEARLAGLLHDRSLARQAQIDFSRLVAIIESSQDAIIGKTLDGRITDWNPAAQTMFGYTANEALGSPVQMLFPPDRQHEEMRILADLARGVRVPPFDTLRQAKDGHLVEVSVTISPIRDADGRIVGASKIARDVSVQRRAEEARIKADRLEAENRQVQEASRLKSLFLANMSHELRTPLNAIIGFADLLHAGVVKPESPKHQTFLGHIGSSGRHLLQLINDILDLSKVESGKFEFFPEPFQLPRLVAEVVDILRTSIDRKSLTLTVTIAPDLGVLMLDPARMKQVLYNLLSNAIKFTPAGGHLGIRAHAEGALHVRLEVEDTGIGIAAAHLPRLFTEFQQLDNSYTKQHQGTGLGLALTRRLVEAQGGSVGVRSQPGRGSVFHVVLNLVHGTDAARSGDPSPDAPVPGPSAPALAAAGAASAVESILAKPLRGAEVASALSRFAGLPAASGPVLVIDDDPLALDLMRTVLQSIGLTTVGHVDGRQALLEIDALAPCAIVLDLMMPGFDGHAVLNALRALPRWRDTPVFIWTSLLLTDEEHAELARSARAILNKGGGALTVVLERLSLWRPEEGRAVSASVASEPSAGPD